uniref:Uncharacterized protein n=1 Tax=Arundo donax TaxID=35708 RepID=A0A0A9G0X2_ARUDO
MAIVVLSSKMFGSVTGSKKTKSIRARMDLPSTQVQYQQLGGRQRRRPGGKNSGRRASVEGGGLEMGSAARVRRGGSPRAA